MFCYALSLALFLALIPIPSLLAAPPDQTQAAQQPQPRKEKKVWTNEDLELLRGKGRVSVIGEVPPPAEAKPAGAEAVAAGGPEQAAAPAEPYVKEKDVKWYQDRLGPLRAELDRIDSDIRRLRDFRTNPTGGQVGVALGQPNISLSPDNQIEQLERRRRDVQRQIDEIQDQARTNGIPLGVLR